MPIGPLVSTSVRCLWRQPSMQPCQMRVRVDPQSRGRFVPTRSRFLSSRSQDMIAHIRTIVVCLYRRGLPNPPIASALHHQRDGKLVLDRHTGRQPETAELSTRFQARKNCVTLHPWPQTVSETCMWHQALPGSRTQQHTPHAQTIPSDIEPPCDQTSAMDVISWTLK